jgi:hypothetical protein
MSLQTDIIFVKALRSNAELITQLPAGDVYNTAIALPDEDADNAEVPYIIVSFDGLNNTDSTKDSSFDGLTDMVTVGIEIAAKTRPQLAELAIMVRDTIRDYFRQHVTLRDDEDYELIPNSYQLQAQQVQYDSLKPCYWQQLAYQCDTDPD